MKNNEKFEEIYRKILEENTNELEMHRLKAQKESYENKKIVINLIIIGIIYILIIYGIFSTNYYVVNWLLIPYVAFATIIYLKYSKKEMKDAYRRAFKVRVISSLIKSFDRRLDYYPTWKMNKEDYINSEFEEIDRMYSEDFVQGVISEKTGFKMGEVLAEKINYNDGLPKYQTTFNGIFVKMKTHKLFDNNFYIRFNYKDEKAIYPFAGSKVQIDSQEFEKFFNVYCSNEILAMQLLTADIIELLMNFYKEMQMRFEITIKEDNIYIRFFSGPMFENASENKDSLDKNMIYKYYKMIDFSLSLTTMLVDLIEDTKY